MSKPKPTPQPENLVSPPEGAAGGGSVTDTSKGGSPAAGAAATPPVATVGGTGGDLLGELARKGSPSTGKVEGPAAELDPLPPNYVRPSLEQFVDAGYAADKYEAMISQHEATLRARYAETMRQPLPADFGLHAPGVVQGRPGVDSAEAITKAEELRRASYGALRDARALDLQRQAASGAGNINHEDLDKAGEKAAHGVERKWLARRQPGVYVVEPCKIADENGFPREYPINTRLPDVMVAGMGEKKIAELVASDLLEDVR